MQLICAPIWGVLSERYGRKPILAIGVLGCAITLFMFSLAKTFTMLFIARSLSGILSSATMPTAMAYIGDNTPQKEKSKGVGQLGAMVGVGVLLGSLMGGFLSTDSLSLPFFCRIRISHPSAPAGDISFAGIKTRFILDG